MYMTKYSVVYGRIILFLRIVMCRIRFWRCCFSGEVLIWSRPQGLPKLNGIAQL